MGDDTNKARGRIDKGLSNIVHFKDLLLFRKSNNSAVVCNFSFFLTDFNSERAKEKMCKKDLIASEGCTMDSLYQELLNLNLGNYNPFCANNRDPGATGNDQCHAYFPVLPSPPRVHRRPFSSWASPLYHTSSLMRGSRRTRAASFL